jgi:hypothetical protein
MGIGGSVILALMTAIGAFLFLSGRKFRARSEPAENLPQYSVVLAPSPTGMVEALTPKWQAELTEKLKAEGYRLIGDYSYAALNFFWARVFLSPDMRTSLLWVNWVEGKEGGKVVISNLEIYSFSGDSFIVTACAQDGAARLLTGANRPTERQMSLHLNAVFAESSVRPIIQEHEKRLLEWEEKGAKVRELNAHNILPSLSKICS